jgi:hypothetical protein
MKNKSYRSAIKRKKISSPLRYLISNSLIKGKVLDYGCGRGDDAAVMSFDKYDPHYFPKYPSRKYQTIICSFVLNILSARDQRIVINQLRDLLKKDGKCYVTVRRDIKKQYKVLDYMQRLVHLKLPSVYRGSDYEVYLLEN